MTALPQNCTQVRPVRVYLDSADYSVLSGPKQKDSSYLELREKLQVWSDSGEVEFWYSGAHISEMAPLECRYTDAAVARSECLSSLCKRQALISYDRLWRYECERLSVNNFDNAYVYSYSGEWFPEMTGIVSPVSWIDGIKELDSSIKEHGLNRASRRAARKKLIKHERPRKELLSVLSGNKLDLSELLDKYPMREQDARVLELYMLGETSAANAERAFLESLRDPKWMMQWFYTHGDKLTHLGEWVRTPAKIITSTFIQVADQVNVLMQRREGLMRQREELLTRAKDSDEVATILETLPPLLQMDSAFWNSQQDAMVVRVADAIVNKNKAGSSFSDDTSVNDVDVGMPGLATAIRVCHSSLGNSMGLAGRRPKNSDWVDCIHAMYAPYVDIFRTDSYMAPIVQDKVKKYGVQVVAKLKTLAPCIEEALQENRYVVN